MPPQQARQLAQTASFHDLIARADQICRQRHGHTTRTYVIERNINYTNVCICRCKFCAFSVSKPTAAGAYTLTRDELHAKIDALLRIGGDQILLQGGLNPDLSLTWHEELLKDLRRSYPKLHIHAYSPPEIAFMADQAELSVDAVLQRLRKAGLDSIPGGGAEILVDRVRQQIAPAKGSAQRWLDAMRQAHRRGICTTATMMFGHVETPAERIEHLQRLRDLQDESLEHREKTGAGGFFTAFTCWPFQPGNTRLSRAAHLRGKLHLADAVAQIRMTALARIVLDNIANIQASWVTQGPQIAQLCLHAGCNDAGSLMLEENVVAAAGTSFAIQLQQLHRLIKNAGFTPQQRDYHYHPVTERSAHD